MHVFLLPYSLFPLPYSRYFLSPHGSFARDPPSAFFLGTLASSTARRPSIIFTTQGLLAVEQVHLHLFPCPSPFRRLREDNDAVGG